MVSYVLFVGVLLAATSIRTGESIKCYVCNEAVDDWCKSPDSTQHLPIDCSYLNESLLHQRTYTKCMKTSQAVDGDNRVIRGCSTDGSDPVYSGCKGKTGTASFKITYCQCREDGCNGVSRLRPQAAVAATSFGAVVAITLLRKLAPTAAVF